MQNAFRLCPVPDSVRDPAWALSWTAASCEIVAETAERARRLAAGLFTVAMHPGEHLMHRMSPWLDPRLVVVEALGEAS